MLGPAPGEAAVAGEADEVVALVDAAERAAERNDHAEVVATLTDVVPATGRNRRLALRRLLALSWSHMYLGHLDVASGLLVQAGALVAGNGFTEVDRAEVLYRTGCCEVSTGEIPGAVARFTIALHLCEHASMESRRLRAHILEWRARSYRRQRELDAAEKDIERALVLAEEIGDEITVAHLTFQASLVAERRKAWLVARAHGERALVLYERHGDRANAQRVLNNLGGIDFLLGDVDGAVSRLQAAFRIALDLGDDVVAAYTMSSLAHVQLHGGRPDLAEGHARRALDLLERRIDHVGEVGNAQLILGHAALAQGRSDEAASHFDAAAVSFDQLASTSHRAAALMGRGDLAARLGDHALAARYFRSAAESLQDVHF